MYSAEKQNHSIFGEVILLMDEEKTQLKKIISNLLKEN